MIDRFNKWWPPGNKAPARATDGFYEYDLDLRDVALEAWQAARRWIPLEEEKPESEILLIVTYYDGLALAYYIDGNFEDEYGNIIPGVEKWQYVPEEK